ncbi:MAG: HEAT repeat domain-containing protein, partial [Candidatus Thermoplasmatota archaeon]|nr:HEAT repeat domain-containing protein [Candidatus Thermoplasmatota archaeon]
VKKYFKKEYDLQTRSAALMAISKFYWKDRSVADVLMEGLKDDSFAIRESAANAIKDTLDLELISRIAPYLDGEPFAFTKRVMREALEVKGPLIPQDFKTVREELDKLRERVTILESRKISKK